jgi:hypothetical protein
MHQQYDQPTLQLAPIAAPDAFDFLGDISGVDRRELARA